ncbi:glycosyltransferase family 2 protein [Vagococcus acidifermentans]|uniref:Glycosyltransferase n=1 Tax=Vagococcus acidifermentans TaxID=564710 RepID=A0A430ATT7_9ENTE|nr:glycosyltransferase family 2 protein [Vagococcus acidifermentans]RSU11461.1 glycosyltransferase [Vagococcus acidifermentans]
MTHTLTIIIPCYNEEEMLPVSSAKITEELTRLIDTNKVSAQSCLLFVDDGSRDDTWQIIEQLHEKNPVWLKGLKLSRNFGHQHALLAGMSAACGRSEMVVTIDADLQDDIHAIEKMVDAYNEGYDVVYGVRSNRDTDTAFKRQTAALFYQLMRKIGVEMVPNHADFRLLSRRAVAALLSFKEQNLFLRGLVPLVGFPSAKVYYFREKRAAGESKYPLKKMVQFAMEGISSFSIMPIRLVRNLGLLTFLIGIVYMFYVLVQKMSGNTETGWSSLAMSIWLLGGVQLIGLSIIGEYIGKIYSEVKRRPRFIIEKNLYSEEQHHHESTDTTHSI